MKCSGRQSRCQTWQIIKDIFQGKNNSQRTDRLHTGSQKELCPSAALSRHLPSAPREEPGAFLYFWLAVQANLMKVCPRKQTKSEESSASSVQSA